MNVNYRVGIKHIPRITEMLLVRVFMEKEPIKGSFKRES